MEKFESNSNTSKQVEEKRVEPVATSSVKKEHTLYKKFFAQDIKSTGRGLTDDVIIPGVKSLVVNILKRGVDYLFLGSSAPVNNGNVNYGSYYAGNTSRTVTFAPTFNPQQRMTQSPVSRNSIYGVSELLFNERGDAEEVLLRMQELINRYGMVSVLDFYDLSNQGKLSTPTDNKYGWKDISSARVELTGGGYRIQFPKVIPLE